VTPTKRLQITLHGFDQNRIWCAIVALAVELTAWMQMLALHEHDARRWEPKRLRLRLFTIPATLARTGRRVMLHLTGRHPWADLVQRAVTNLRPRGARLIPQSPAPTNPLDPRTVEPAPTRNDTRAACPAHPAESHTENDSRVGAAASAGPMKDRG
jgi:hypothetical protein